MSCLELCSQNLWSHAIWVQTWHRFLTASVVSCVGSKACNLLSLSLIRAPLVAMNFWVDDSHDGVFVLAILGYLQRCRASKVASFTLLLFSVFFINFSSDLVLPCCDYSSLIFSWYETCVGDVWWLTVLNGKSPIIYFSSSFSRFSPLFSFLSICSFSLTWLLRSTVYKNQYYSLHACSLSSSFAR